MSVFFDSAEKLSFRNPIYHRILAVILFDYLSGRSLEHLEFFVANNRAIRKHYNPTLFLKASDNISHFLHGEPKLAAELLLLIVFPFSRFEVNNLINISGC